MKREKLAAREKNGRIKREAAQTDYGTPEFRAHRAAAVGAARAHDPRASHALGILEMAGVITAAQCHAGTAWAAAMYATYGKPWPGCVNLEGLPGGTPQGPPEAKERQARAGAEAIDRCGWRVSREVRLIAHGNNLPDWYHRSRSASVMLANARCQALLTGLDALE